MSQFNIVAAIESCCFLSGGSASKHSVQPDLLDDQQKSNYSFEESGRTSNYSVQGELSDGLLRSNSSFEEDAKSSIGNCTLRDVLRYLKLSKTNENSMVRPGNQGSPTKIDLYVMVFAIIDVNEKDQKFVSYLWIDMIWHDENVTWNPDDFCNITNINVPTEVVWTPDLTIEEMTEKDKALPSPYVWVFNNGKIFQRISMVVTSTCKMEVYKFPFDVQSCNLSFKSVMHSDDHILFLETGSSSLNWSKKMMLTQSEWLFIDMLSNNKTTNNFGVNQKILVYTITMKRRPVLYVANFLLPVLFFFCLDLASFLISETGGEKLSFKVTVLLAITVMQLILNEILPSSSDSVPLVAIYCIGMFGLMMISLFETILVMYLMGKDNEADEDQRLKSEDCEDKRSKVSCCSCCKVLKKWTHCAHVCDVSVDEPPSELLSATKEGSSRELTEESVALEKLSDELKEVIQLLNSREEAGKLGYWTRVAKTINKVFFISYVTVAIVFLVVIFSLWNSEIDK
ncbi:5-hydroxytryptamine receptor 3A-like [Centropristis striata]|uniref:5-hydroxytryptamine receptor 3A-like n=1 Tax=Centropristis striata TaxID=184440 RepID=UPI0027DF5521|nr:5-hydroxytryptamine receptor 3A-like [Centropristis striata]